MNEQCLHGNHDWIVIYSSGEDVEEEVVRWCQECGSIVVDLDYDERTNPGQIMKMKSPNYIKHLRKMNRRTSEGEQ